MGEELTLHGEPARFGAGFERVGEETWAWLQPNGLLGESNAGLVASGRQALLVDTLWDLRLTRRMLAEARSLVEAEPEVVFNTHSDGDHVWGNQLLAGARIVSTAKARELMTLDTPAELRRLKRLGRLVRPLGRETAPFDWDGVELTLPGETFEGELTLEIGERRVELIEVGPAHTGGDAVAWLPDVGVCFAADVLFIGCTPITWAGPLSGWLGALDRISALGATTFVPGHGPVCSREEVDLLREYLEWAEREGGALLDRGTPPARAARRTVAQRRVRVAALGGVGRPGAAGGDAQHRALPPRRRRGAPDRLGPDQGDPADGAAESRAGEAARVSGAPEPGWHELPDRTGDPRIRRSPLHRAAIALARRATKGRSYQFMRVVSIDRRLFRPFLSFNARLMPRGKLDRRLTEALILRTAWLCGSRYEWTQHTAIGRRAGLTPEQIEAIGADPGSELLDEEIRRLLPIVPELLERHALSPETYDSLAAQLPPARILEAVMLVGNYAMLAGALNSFGVPLEKAWDRGQGSAAAGRKGPA